jgi:hypothetical protein
MKRVYIICCNAIVLSFLLLGCGNAEQESSKQEPSEALGEDKPTGLSRTAVNAQLKIGIYSPYNLIEITKKSISAIALEDFTPKKLRNILKERVLELMPKESNEVREEIVEYLVKYYIKNLT